MTIKQLEAVTAASVITCVFAFIWLSTILIGGEGLFSFSACAVSVIVCVLGGVVAVVVGDRMERLSIGGGVYRWRRALLFWLRAATLLQVLLTMCLQTVEVGMIACAIVTAIFTIGSGASHHVWSRLGDTLKKGNRFFTRLS